MTYFKADHPGATVRISPNCSERRHGAVPSILLLHYTGMESGGAAEDWLCSADSQVSSHYLVHEDGRIVQLVSEEHRAWHAGAGCWRGYHDVNSASIGIEIVNPGHGLGYPDFANQQIEAVIDLCSGIVERHGIVPQNVLAHSDVAPGRKVDPGEKFPWARLCQAGIGHFVDPAPLETSGEVFAPGAEGAPVKQLQSMLSTYGYGLEITGHYDDRTQIVVAAFQRHFRPARVDGLADPSTMQTLCHLLSSLPASGD